MNKESLNNFIIYETRILFSAQLAIIFKFLGLEKALKEEVILSIKKYK